MIPAEVQIRLIGGKLSIRPASVIPEILLAEIRDNRDTAIRLIEAGPEFDPVTVLNEFRGDLADIAHCTDEQLRQAVQIAAAHHGWKVCR